MMLPKKWQICIILFLATTLNYLDRQTLSILAPSPALTLVNFGPGIWVVVYLTLAQEVSATHISMAIGLLSGCGSLAGALAMWAVGQVTQRTASFAIPMSSVALAAALAAAGGRMASNDSPKEAAI